MKLRMLAVTAGLAMLPVLASAQTPTDTTKKDSTMKDTTMSTMPMKDTTMKDTTMKDTTMTPAPMTPAPTAPAPAPMASTSSSSSTMPAMKKDSSLEPKKVPPSDGTTCPWGCPTSKGAAGLTGPQFLALQQELRDRKCGASHVTGRLDAATRIAIRNCARKMGVKNNAAAVLVGMDVGYGASDVSMPNGEDE